MGKEKTSRSVADKIRTRIWADIPGDNGDITVCRGYDFYSDLLGRYSWTDLVFLHLRGELPSTKESLILNLVMSGVINPGPRDWSTHAAMTASVAGTTVGNSLLSGLAVLQGRYHGALCVEKSAEMLREGVSILQAEKIGIPDLIAKLKGSYQDLPGYGLYQADRDQRASRLAELVREEDRGGEHLTLAFEIEKEVSANKGIWLTIAGVVAAALSDLGFSSKEAHGIFLLSAAPGILAHLIEQMGGGWHTFPFFDHPEYTGPATRRPRKDQMVYGD